MTPTTPALITTAEVAHVLGVTRGRVLELAVAAVDFPDAGVWSPGGWAWPRGAIEAWAASHQARGPLQPGPRIPPLDLFLGQAPQIGRLFRLAVEEAQALGHPSVDQDHLLLAFLHPGCPGEAGAVLRSFGIAVEPLRGALVASAGDPFEASSEPLAFDAYTQLLFERANLEAVLLRDVEVASEHVLLALTNRWDRGVASRWLGRCGIDAAAVRRRVVDLTEGVPLPEPSLAVPEPESDPTAGLDLAPTPDGWDPRRRRPWGSLVFTTADGQPIRQGRALRQYFMDRDGNPVLASDGRPVHVLLDEQGNEVLDTDGRPLIGPVDVPSGARVGPRSDAS
jgi:hypothetical protein